MAQTWDELRAIPTQATPRLQLRKLTDSDAATIRERFATQRELTIVGLAREYNVSQDVIYKILSHQTYRSSYPVYNVFRRDPGHIEPMPCSLDTAARAAAQNVATATVASIPGRTWQHSPAYLADHAEHAEWMTTPQPDLAD